MTKTMTNDEKIDRMLKFYHGTKTLKDYLLEMAEWKQQQMIDKTIKFIYHKMNDTNELDVHNIEKLINDYKEAMKEE